MPGGHGTAMVRFALVLTAAVLTFLSGCGARTSVHQPAAGLPTPTATTAVGFAVEVTSIAISTPSPTLVAPTPTAFVAPRGPYIVVIPASGPPESRSVTVRGGNLPGSSPVQLSWSSRGNTAPISKVAYTDGRGHLKNTFLVPSVSVGTYQIRAAVGGQQVATATYRVKSAAILSVGVTPVGKGYRLRVRGAHFLRGLRLLLVAYPMVRGEKSIVLGTTRATQRGRLSFSYLAPHLRPGQYVLRAYAASLLSSQMAETFFQVVV